MVDPPKERAYQPETRHIEQGAIISPVSEEETAELMKQSIELHMKA